MISVPARILEWQFIGYELSRWRCSSLYRRNTKPWSFEGLRFVARCPFRYRTTDLIKITGHTPSSLNWPIHPRRFYLLWRKCLCFGPCSFKKRVGLAWILWPDRREGQVLTYLCHGKMQSLKLAVTDQAGQKLARGKPFKMVARGWTIVAVCL